MKTLQSLEIKELNENSLIIDAIAVRMLKSRKYTLMFMTTENKNCANLLVTQKNKTREFKTLDSVDSFLLSIKIYNFKVMSEMEFNAKCRKGN
jgi:hypothetical protein